ncbi:STAS domain-containing protein [Aquibacillus sediminis]|uniref:STAS domain-containing protein n=1 Tax=Aquibacillus sediminis TaxID=2574734 RepID=UPI00110882F4|nr:STAS domain-containing protein [Aquibacillus sediminis]
MLEYITREDGERIEVELKGDLDIEGTEIIEGDLTPLLESYKTIVLNFEAIPFVDSSGIGLLINLVQTLQESGKKVKISHVRDEVFDVFDILQLPEILGSDVFE